jgi:hypothetical protein
MRAKSSSEKQSAGILLFMEQAGASRFCSVIQEDRSGSIRILAREASRKGLIAAANRRLTR